MDDFQKIPTIKFYDFYLGFYSYTKDQFRYLDLKIPAQNLIHAIQLFQLYHHGPDFKKFHLSYSIVTKYYYQVQEFERITLPGESSYTFNLIRVYHRADILKLF